MIKNIKKILLIKNKKIIVNNNKFFQDLKLKKLNLEKKVYRKKIRYRGIGYKIFLLKNQKKLYLKLGLSYKPKISVPSSVQKIRFKRGNLLFIGKNEIQLGNFIHLLYQLKPQNSYKLKGFILAHRKKKVKVINKK